MNIDALNRDHGVAGRVEFLAGRGSLPMIHVHNDAADAVISIYGGQVLSYRPKATGREMLFLSEHAYYAEGKAIKGGVPVCWPWFGADPEGKGRPAHGFARNRMWSVFGVDASNDGVTKVTIGFDSDDDTRKLWPHDFRLRLVVTVGPELGLELVTSNTGSTAFQLTQALHTYFSIGAIAATEVHGLGGCRFLDKAHGGGEVVQDGPVTFAGEVDAVYMGVDSLLSITDGAQQRRIEIASEGSHTAVVWNPWEAIAKSMADLADDDYTRLVCVETTNAANEVITVPADGGSHRMVARYRDISA
ncbi:MAG: D-hexose-6-phosphate mutarotase [Chromatiales bacterium]|nr:D-hexose-6-phosphate mutarotase [Gammaproteobacteria bacterium]MCP5352209.1 D-hexose-6-phosphate mutarotase [Chromatiales bacterium]